MSVDPRLLHIDLDDAQADREPVDTLHAQLGVLADNLMAGYLKSPARTDAMLRRDGMTDTADRLVELFGAEWWTRLD